MLKALHPFIRYFLLLTGGFALLRLLVILLYAQAAVTPDAGTSSQWLQAFVIGLRFDVAVVCMMLLLPLQVFLLSHLLLGRLPLRVLQFLHVILFISLCLVTLIALADLPFLGYFGRRIDSGIFVWRNAPAFAVKMFFSQCSYAIYLPIFLLLVFFLQRASRRMYRQQRDAPPIPAGSKGKTLLLWIVISGGLVLGIRGRIAAKSPLLAGAAYFCEIPFLNLLAQNPVYGFTRSMLDECSVGKKTSDFCSSEIAARTLRNEFGLDTGKSSSAPQDQLYRIQQGSASFKGRNLVLVIMESMAAHRMKHFGNDWNLTPYLDSLMQHSYCFDSVFSCGIHTFNGIYSTLYGHPAIMGRHTMDQVYVPQMDGLPQQLSRIGYQTVFFTTHDEMFDNMAGFLSANGFRQIIGEKDYPRSEIKSSMGVPDEFLFRYAVPVLTQLASRGTFFATFMTGSNHGPLYIPRNTGFVPRSLELDLQATEYADWSVQKFMSYAANQKWYHNTVFVFIADHGVPLWNDRYEMPFSYHHIPFFIFDPRQQRGEYCKKLGLQSDVYPTLMGLLSPQFVNRTAGIDLLHERHRHIVCSSDDVLSCMNDSLLYVWKPQSAHSALYRFREQGANCIGQMPQQAALMKLTALSWLQWSLDWVAPGRQGRQ